MGQFNKGGSRNRGRDGGGYKDNFNSGGFKRDFGPREMHKAVCADCGNECEVPFKPSGERPVYCRECFQSHKKF
ncbi:CxxC-x17-CxxC domain-containing protein [Nanoarchaeota archaeon]